MTHKSSGPGRPGAERPESKPEGGRRTDSVSLALRQLWKAEVEPVPDSFLQLLSRLDAAQGERGAAIAGDGADGNAGEEAGEEESGGEIGGKGRAT